MTKPTEKKLLDRVRDAAWVKHCSIRTEQAYVFWAKHFIFFYNLQHSKDMGSPEIEVFLTHMAVEQNVATSLKTRPLPPYCSFIARCSSKTWKALLIPFVPTIILPVSR